MRRWLAVALWVIPITGMLALAVSAAPGPASSSGAASASAPVLGAAALVAGSQIPMVRSSPPPPAAWKDAKPVGLARSSATDCSALLVREWLRVQCRNYAGVGLVAGDPKEVRTSLTGLPPGMQAPGETGESLVQVELPLVRGASYVVTFLGLGSDYEGNMIDEADTLHISWRPGAPDPVLIMTAAN